jgi:hypothetical protein
MKDLRATVLGACRLPSADSSNESLSPPAPVTDEVNDDENCSRSVDTRVPST